MASKRERATVLREAGLGYAEIARALQVGIGTAHRWVNPETEERGRETARAWKDAHREHNRARDRQHHYDTKDPCPHCDAPKLPEASTCRDYFLATAAVRRSVTEGMWADGWTHREINDTLGVSGDYIGPRRVRDGWDLPHRYKVQNGRRVAA